MFIIAMGNLKGGVGKTTTVLNVGTELARAGARVLLVDLDPQASLTQMFSIEVDEEHSLTAVIGQARPGSKRIEEIIEEVGERLYLAPSDITLFDSEQGLLQRPKREEVLRKILVPLDEQFDYAVLDLPPSFGNLVTNGLVAADVLVIPTILDAMAVRGIKLFLTQIGRLEAAGLYVPQILGLVPTMTDYRSNAAKITRKALEGFGLYVFTTSISRAAGFAEAAALRLPIRDHQRNHRGTEEFTALTKEIIERAKATATAAG